MGLFARLRRLLSTPSLDEEEEANYRCIQCGEPHGRQVSNCRNCGGSFVAPVEDDDGDVQDPRSQR